MTVDWGSFGFSVPAVGLKAQALKPSLTRLRVTGFVYGWRMALVIIAVLPILIVGAYFQTKFMTGASSQVNAFGAWHPLSYRLRSGLSVDLTCCAVHLPSAVPPLVCTHPAAGNAGAAVLPHDLLRV